MSKKRNLVNFFSHFFLKTAFEIDNHLKSVIGIEKYISIHILDQIKIM